MVQGSKTPPVYPLHYLYRVLDCPHARKLSWGKIQWEPATNQLDWSFAPIPAFDERARQYRYRLPPRFPPASPNAGIARWFSGRNF